MVFAEVEPEEKGCVNLKRCGSSQKKTGGEESCCVFWITSIHVD